MQKKFDWHCAEGADVPHIAIDVLDPSLGVLAIPVRGGVAGKPINLGMSLSTGTGSKLSVAEAFLPPVDGWHVVVHRRGAGPTTWERECVKRIKAACIRAPLLGITVCSETGTHVLLGEAP